MIKEVWYDRNGDTRQVRVNGRTVQNIAQDGRTHIITDEKGSVTRKAYDEKDNLTRIVYPDGSEVSYTYEYTFNRRTRAVDENGIVTTFAYDAAGNLTDKMEAFGTDAERTSEYEYDESGNLTLIRQVGDANTEVAETVMTYDAIGNLTSVIDPEGGVTQFTAHDAMGNVLTKIDARGKTWTYTYDEAGNLKTVTDPLSSVTTFDYDKAGNKIKETDAEGRERIFAYDGHYNLVTVTDDLGGVTAFEYSPDNKLIRQIDAEGRITRYEYDTEGRLLKTIDGAANEIGMEYDDGPAACASCTGDGGSQPDRVVYPTFERSFVYDARGQKTIERDHVDAATELATIFAYDPAGNLVSRIDRADKVTGYTYDGLNRLSRVIDPAEGVTRYAYDDRGNLLTLTDAKDQTTGFAYDKANRLVTETRPLGQETAYIYDTAGNLVEKLDAKNQKTAYVYDDAGRLTEIKHFNPVDPVNPVKTVVFTYDKVGNLKTYADGTTSGLYEYDVLNRKTSETVNYGSFSVTNTNTYTYYANGQKKTFTGADGITYTYAYDAASRLASVDIPGSGQITVNSYTWNRPETMTLPGGSQRTFAYDPLMRVKQIQSKDPAQNTVANYNYTYDAMDNITVKATEHGAYNYGYDDLYRLTTADNAVAADEAFTYDPVGNRLTASDTTVPWAYNTNNELSGFDATTFTYDVNGNMTRKAVDATATGYVYNTEDRLSEVWAGEPATGSLTATYYYDPFGRRLWKDVAGVKTHFVYADEGLVGELDSSGAVTKTYGYRPGSTWTTDPLFMKVGGSYYFYHTDHLGTPQKMTDVNGAVVWSGTYMSFGEATVGAGSTVESNFRFAGQYFDQESGLHYNYHRYFDSIAGRYIKPDPIGLAGGIGLYTYVGNNSVLRIDPYGLYVGGVGLGVTAAKSVKKKLGISASGAVLWVHDDQGNEALALCWSGGGAIGQGFVAGLQTSHLPGVKTIYDLESNGLSLGVGGGGGRIFGAAVDVSKSGVNVIMGAARGGFGGAVNIVGGCEIIKVLRKAESNSTEGSEACQSKSFFGINPLDGEVLYERKEDGSGVYRGKIKNSPIL